MNVLVTGGSRGIGYAIAKECLNGGHSVAIASLHKESVEEALGGLLDHRNDVWGMSCDVGSLEDLDELRSACEDRDFAVDVLVLNAGVFYEGSLLNSDANDFRETLKINFESAYFLVRHFISHLRKSKYPRIIIIGSTAAYEPYPVGALYGVSKWALRGYAINLRKELMTENIGVTFVAPGGTYTDLWKDDDVQADRLMEPRDVGLLVAASLQLSPQAVIEELIVRPMLGDIHE
jgi:NAD(P)-dependent dehydrogenase (short-subunit alcohol dehydrogenase family)